MDFFPFFFNKTVSHYHFFCANSALHKSQSCMKDAAISLIKSKLRARRALKKKKQRSASLSSLELSNIRSTAGKNRLSLTDRIKILHSQYATITVSFPQVRARRSSYKDCQTYRIACCVSIFRKML